MAPCQGEELGRVGGCDEDEQGEGKVGTERELPKVRHGESTPLTHRTHARKLKHTHLPANAIITDN